jgi:predicted nucleic acid-binding Zn finger protein
MEMVATTGQANFESPVATATTLHPIQLLDTFLKDLEKVNVEGDQRQDRILRAADFLLGPSILEGALAILDSPESIRLLQSPNRCAYLVQGGGFYYCSNEIRYCSCRSFLERTKSDPQTVCKHLLALKLMPYLGVAPPIQELVSDGDYGKIVMLRVFVD